MKKPLNPVLKEELGAMLYTCIVCGNKTEGAPYGRWGEVGGTCQKSCEAIQEAKPRDFGETHEHKMVSRLDSGVDSDVSTSSTS